MTNIPFVKASGAGNDFLIVDAKHAPQNIAEITRRMCDRNEGVGADGVEWLSPDPVADVRARLINSDGSDAEVSGNGTRCVAAWLASQKPKDVITVRTDAGIKSCKLMARDGANFEFEADMGEPQVGDPFSIKLAFGVVTGVPVSMGNPHFVVFVDKFATGWQADAAEIGAHHDFKQGMNVELVKIREENNIHVRFFERGAGETKSSGTGSCAAAVASIHSGKVKSPVRIHTPGGIQTVRWEGEVFLRGPARLVCQGEFFV
jgi:diaminopimelate epimerase